MVRSDGDGFLQRNFGGLSRTTFLLALSSMFADISTEMLYPVLPVFLTQTPHATGRIVGLVDGFAQALQNIVQGFSGTLSDKLQRRKPIALFGYLIAAIAKPLMGLATVWQVVFGARLLDRLGAGSRSAPRDALIAASVDERNRGRAFGLEGLGDNDGAFLGPLLTLFLLYAFQIGIRWVFYLAIIPGLIAFCMVLFVDEPRTTRPKAPRRRSACSAFRALLEVPHRHRTVRPGQFEQRFSDLAHTRHRCVSAGDKPDLRRLQSRRRANFLSCGWLFDHWGGRNVLLGAYVIFPIAYLGFGLTDDIRVARADAGRRRS